MSRLKHQGEKVEEVVAQMVERLTSGQEVMGSILSSGAHSLMASGWCQYNVTKLGRSHDDLALSVWQHVKMLDVSLRTCPRDSLVADKDVKKAWR